MGAPLNIRDIGEARKQALLREAELRGASLADVVREFIDAGVARAQAARARTEWIAAARDGLADEAQHLDQNGPNLDQNGPTLARFRTLR